MANEPALVGKKSQVHRVRGDVSQSPQERLWARGFWRSSLGICGRHPDQRWPRGPGYEPNTSSGLAHPAHQGTAAAAQPGLTSSSCPSIPATYLDHTGLRPRVSQENSDAPTQSHLWQHHFFVKMLLLLPLPPFLLPSKLLIRRSDDMGRSKFQACPQLYRIGT